MDEILREMRETVGAYFDGEIEDYGAVCRKLAELSSGLTGSKKVRFINECARYERICEERQRRRVRGW